MLMALKIVLACAAAAAAVYGVLTLRSAARLRTQASDAVDGHLAGRLENAADLDGHVGRGSLFVAFMVAAVAALL